MLTRRTKSGIMLRGTWNISRPIVKCVHRKVLFFFHSRVNTKVDIDKVVDFEMTRGRDRLVLLLHNFHKWARPTSSRELLRSRDDVLPLCHWLSLFISQLNQLASRRHGRRERSEDASRIRSHTCVNFKALHKTYESWTTPFSARQRTILENLRLDCDTYTIISFGVVRAMYIVLKNCNFLINYITFFQRYREIKCSLSFFFFFF